MTKHRQTALPLGDGQTQECFLLALSGIAVAAFCLANCRNIPIALVDHSEGVSGTCFMPIRRYASMSSNFVRVCDHRSRAGDYGQSGGKLDELRSLDVPGPCRERSRTRASRIFGRKGPSSRTGLLPSSPLRTVHESFLSHSSSPSNASFGETRFRDRNLLAMNPVMALWMK